MLGTQRAKMQQSKRNASIPKKKKQNRGTHNTFFRSFFEPNDGMFCYCCNGGAPVTVAAERQ